MTGGHGATENQVALITGVTSGVGRGVATTFAQLGIKVVGMGRRAELGAMLEKEVREADGELVFVQGDVRQSADCTRAVQAAVDSFGRLDVLINNAGIEGHVGDLHSLTDEQWDEVIDINLSGVFRATRAALLPMLRQQSGVILNISSINGAPGFAIAHMAPYNTSKAAVVQFTRTVATEYMAHGVRANTIILGAVPSEMHDRVRTQVAQYMRGPDFVPDGPDALGAMLMQSPEEVGRALAALCQPACALITGATIALDRSMTAGFITSTGMHMAAAQLMPG